MSSMFDFTGWVTGAVRAVTLAVAALVASAQAAETSGVPSNTSVVLRPARVWTEGEPVHTGWVVLVEGNHVAEVGTEKSVKVPAGAQVVDLPDSTLLPGLIDAHSH